MKKILTSLSIIGLVGAMALSATMSYLSDTETSAGNLFKAGAIDLKVDNESYYNGEEFPGTTFEPSDLDDGILIIDFQDLKPDDEGEDTISLHVNNNDAYLCMDMSLTSDDDISSNEPELETGDAVEDPNNTWDGELAGLIEMIWWADDGDNVLEEGEMLLNGGVQNITDLFGADRIFTADLADSTTNVWTGTPGPVNGGETYYIGKGWCFGDMILYPLPQDGVGDIRSPIGPDGSGFSCEGRGLGNESQTDGVTIDIAFRAVQARHNGSYTCEEEEPRLATLTVYKQIVNDNGGNNVIGDFQLLVIGAVTTYVTSGIPTTFAPGDYVVGETGVSGYEATFSGNCDADGNITLAENGTYSCTITNNDIRPNITLIKNVINDNNGTAVPTDFTMRVNGVVVPTGSSKSVNSKMDIQITEDSYSGYTPIGITGAGCPSNLGDTFQLDEGVAITCTITNDDNPQ